MTALAKAEAIHQQARAIDRLCVEIEVALAQLKTLEPEYRQFLVSDDRPEMSGHGFSGFANTARDQINQAVSGQWLNRGHRSLAQWLSNARPQHFPQGSNE